MWRDLDDGEDGVDGGPSVHAVDLVQNDAVGPRLPLPLPVPVPVAR